MKIILKVFLAVILIGAATGSLIFCITSGYLDRQVGSILEYYLNIKGIKAKLDELHIKDNQITIKKITAVLSNNSYGEINDLHIQFTNPNVISTREFKASFEAGKFEIKNELHQSVLNAIPSGYYLFNLKNNQVQTELALNDIDANFESILDTGSKKVLGTGYCNYDSETTNGKYLGCKFSLNNKSSFSFEAKMREEALKIQAKLNYIPIAIYKCAEKIMPQNKLFNFLDGFFKTGYIDNGELNINLNEDYAKNNVLTPENLTGKFDIRDLEFKYEKDFPSLKNAELDVNIAGTRTEIFLKKAFISSTLISDGIITLDYMGASESRVIITASARGPVADLTDFIPKKPLDKTKKFSIDLQKFTGTANTNIELAIPLATHSHNTYNITTEASNVGLKIFNDDLELKDTKFRGSFDGAQILINGAGKINNFESNLSYCFNLKDGMKYDQLLQIKTKIKAQNQKIGLVKVLAGSGLFDFEYKVKGEQSTVNANADLKKTEFYVDKIAIHKLKGEKADLNIQGDLKDFPNTSINFNLIGDNNLKIVGKLVTGDSKYKLALPFITHKDTDIKGDIEFDKENYIARIEGSKLDLSGADMMHFLEKDKESSDSDLKIKVEKIRLKNNIHLDNFFLTIKCTKTRCYKGYLDSKIGSKFFKMLLKTFDDKEEWIITTTNTGALFKGLGLYNNMKTGAMLLILNTKRQEVKQGEIIPILDGTFTFRNFVVIDTPFLTRLVSFVSLPGLKNLVTNNKDIIFKNMNGKFSYNNDLINMSESSAEGPFLDFTMTGKVDTQKRKIDLSGNVIPSMYGLSTLVKNIPVLGKLFAGGHRKGIIFAPYSVHQSY